MATQPSRWKKRSLRCGAFEIRLAVRFATQPLGNVNRALAMSMFRVSTGMPTASMRSGCSPRICCRMSRSWIIRSRTTSMSVARSEKGPMRWASTKRGLRMRPPMHSSAELNHSRCPTCSTRPPASARASSFSASRRLAAIGFSTSTSRPASSASLTTA